MQRKRLSQALRGMHVKEWERRDELTAIEVK